jgi:hypothetical protein
MTNRESGMYQLWSAMTPSLPGRARFEIMHPEKAFLTLVGKQVEALTLGFHPPAPDTGGRAGLVFGFWHLTF